MGKRDAPTPEPEPVRPIDQPPPDFVPAEQPVEEPPREREQRRRSMDEEELVDDNRRERKHDDDDASWLATYLTRGKQKTFKREVGVIALIFWGVITYRVFWSLGIEHIRALESAYGVASTAIWLYVASAYGLDAFMKGSPRGRGGDPYRG